MNDLDKRISKFLSLVLRHNPQKIGIILDKSGWVSVDELITKSSNAGLKFSREKLFEIVANSDKKRFTLSEDQLLIRAAQGHSINIDLGLEPKQPPKTLYHGTATRFLESINSKGIIAGTRDYVHLSADIETALKVGARHGKPIILRIAADIMAADGIEFFQAENGVWLTKYVNPEYFALID